MFDVDAPDLVRFPRFADAQLTAQIAKLEPGDALHVPSLWWHAVKSEDEVRVLANFGGAMVPLPIRFRRSCRSCMRC